MHPVNADQGAPGLGLFGYRARLGVQAPCHAVKHHAVGHVLEVRELVGENGGNRARIHIAQRSVDSDAGSTPNPPNARGGIGRNAMRTSIASASSSAAWFSGTDSKRAMAASRIGSCVA